MTRDEALKLAEKIGKHPAPCTHEHAKRALMLLYLKTLEQHLREKHQETLTDKKPHSKLGRPREITR